MVGEFAPGRADTSMVTFSLRLPTVVSAIAVGMLTAAMFWSRPSIVWIKIAGISALGLAILSYVTAVVWVVGLNMNAYISAFKRGGRVTTPYISHFAVVCVAVQIVTTVVGCVMAILCFFL
jgi:hypothetical protein